MRTLRYCLTGLCLCGVLTVFGQDNGGAAQFPAITPDVKGVAMGNTGVATTNNAFSLWRNAAKSVFSDKKAEIGYSFTPWMRELISGNDVHGAAGYYNLDEKQGIVAGFRFFKHAEIDLGKETGHFTPKDWSIDVGYARKLTDDLSVGAIARFVRSDLSGMDDDAVANAVAFDLGVYYRRDYAARENTSWAIGLQLSNLGTKIDYGYNKYDQPAKVVLGGMLDYPLAEKHVLQGTLEVGYRILPDGLWESALGVEYKAFDLVSVRGGYHFGEQNNRMQRYGTLGCGVHLWRLQADFAWLLPETDSFLKNTWQLSIGFVINE